LAFVAVALAAVLLALAPPPGSARPGVEVPRMRPLLTMPMAQLSVSAFVSYFGAAALPFLVALYAEDRLALRPETTGLVLLGFGVAGVLLGAVWGSVAARFDAWWCAGLAAVVTAVLVAGTGRTTSLLELVLCWTAAGASNSMLNVGCSTSRCARCRATGVAHSPRCPPSGSPAPRSRRWRCSRCTTCG
jgi:predicted MFS family arabinose efflux permease